MHQNKIGMPTQKLKNPIQNGKEYINGKIRYEATVAGLESATSVFINCLNETGSNMTYAARMLFSTINEGK